MAETKLPKTSSPWRDDPVGMPGEVASAIVTEQDDLSMQMRLLDDPDHKALVVVEYVDAKLGFCEAREVVGGLPVSMTPGRTSGLVLENLRVGSRFIASITHYQHATTVEDVAH